MDFELLSSHLFLFWKMVKCLIDHKWLRKLHFFVCYRNDDHLLRFFFLRKRRYWFDFPCLFLRSSNENLLSFWLLDFSHENWSCRVFMDSDKNLKLLPLISHDRQTSMKKEGGKKSSPMSKVSTMQTHKMMAWLRLLLLKKISRGLSFLKLCMQSLKHTWKMNVMTSPLFCSFQTVIYISNSLRSNEEARKTAKLLP